MIKPPEEVREEKNGKLLNLITESVLRYRGIGDREKLPSDLTGEGVKKYIRENKEVLENIEVHEADLEPDGRPDSVTMEFPGELQVLLDRSQKRVNLD